MLMTKRKRRTDLKVKAKVKEPKDQPEGWVKRDWIPNPQPTTPKDGGKWTKDPDRAKRKGKPIRLYPEEEQLIKDQRALKKEGKDLIKIPCRTCGALVWTPVEGKIENDPVDTLCVKCYSKVSKKVITW